MTTNKTKPCIKCGGTDRYKSGRCATCHRVAAKKWQKNNPEKVLEIKRQYRKNNPEKVRQNSSDWQKNNPEKARKKAMRWQKNNPEKRRTYRSRRRTAKTQAGGSYTPYEWEALCKQYDYRCLKCQREFPYKKLTADHVLPVAMGGSSNIENIQPLCKSCNSSKGAKCIDYRNKRGLLRWIQRKLF